MDKPVDLIYLSIMFQENARYQPGATAGALAVHSIWHVKADVTYDVAVGPWHWKRLTVVRTLAGAGELTPVRGEPYAVPADSLVLFVGTQLRRYRCPGRHWHFWWLEVDTAQPPALPLHEVLDLPGAAAADVPLLTLAFTALRKDQPAQVNVAAAAVSLLLHQCKRPGTARCARRRARTPWIGWSTSCTSTWRAASASRPWRGPRT